MCNVFIQYISLVSIILLYYHTGTITMQLLPNKQYVTVYILQSYKPVN